MPSEKQSVFLVGKGVFQQLSEALSLAGNKDVIILSEGNFPVGQVINTSIHIKGAGANKTFLYCDDESIDYVLKIISDECILEDMAIIANKKTSEDQMYGLYIDSKENQLINLTISQTFYGIYITSTSHHNTFSNVSITESSYGMFLKSSVNNIIEYSNFTNIRYYGLFLSFAEDNEISNCDFNLNGEYALYIDKGSNNTSVHHCRLINNANGLRIKSSNNCNIKYNLVSGNDHGVLLCCGASNNSLNMNSFLKNIVNGADEIGNTWYDYVNEYGQGNYWDDYLKLYPNATMVTDESDTSTGIFSTWDTTYSIALNGIDRYPLIKDPLKSI